MRDESIIWVYGGVWKVGGGNGVVDELGREE
jgi:hypothetical protein